MLKQLTPEKVIDIIWFSVALAVCWPLSSSASKAQVVAFKILQICSAISALILLLPLLYSTYLHFDDVIVLSQSICLSMGVFQMIMQTVICFTNYDLLQRIITEMITYVKEAQQFEREILHNYIQKCKLFYGGSLIWTYLCATCFVLGPVVLPNPFPSSAEYPFRVNRTPMNAIVYLHQSFISFQYSAHICVSIFGALLLWITAARFHCLTLEVQQSSSIHMLIICVKKQLLLRRYAKEVVDGFRLIVLNAIAMSILALTLSSITLIMEIPLIVKVQFVTVSFTVLAEIYMYAWSADYMKDMSAKVSQSVYDLTWYGQTLEMQKNVLYILVHQEPVILSVSCIVPELSLRYYCSYLSNAFSVFTALRVVLDAKSA
ncbi:PREDICTED: uncharacterized protein LOC108580236 [Habropoda laboriosa]|uniref:uncharacterized protein LOC108580236 n=1 Tax=Habropoda laboriosa TaxID=597456 RepID=UPI00083E4B91|nr:PREDICTED: uncharacterized protein LOC108580236 [Habropoda laboriosa]